MTIGLATLQSYWKSASARDPLIIFGAGRWGRVWVDVATAVRGGAAATAIVARGNHAETVTWKNADSRRDGLLVAQTPEEALTHLAVSEKRLSGIVASRPGDHGRDIGFCIANAIPALVEKPFTADVAEGMEAIASAEQHAVTLAIGTEYAFLPALHFMLSRLDAAPLSAELDWSDPPAEERHGARKRIHGEITLLDDILPHAMSIFREIGGHDRLMRLSDAAIGTSGDDGHIIFAAPDMGAHLRASRTASGRKRFLTIVDELGGRHFLDFASPEAVLSIDGRVVQIPKAYRYMSSTLRLELGAWQTMLAAGPSQARSIATPALYVQAQAELAALLG